MTDAAADDQARAEELERNLASKASWILPLTTVVAAIGVGIAFGVGPGILVLAAGALVGVIALLWASLRTLAGDAPLADGLFEAAATRGELTSAADRKRRVLRSLKDLELEHSVGKIDDDDYAEISGKYREQAKDILREMDVEIGPLRVKAEALADAHLAKVGLKAKPAPAKTLEPESPRESGRESQRETKPSEAPSGLPRVVCAHCQTSNEVDAAFCKKCRARLGRLECPSCATSNEPDATFCKKCGTSIGAARESEAKDA